MPLWMPNAHAAGLSSLDDADLARVAGRDGVAFNLKGFAMSGPLSFTYTSPEAGSPSLSLGNLSLSRSDDEAHTFTDPYRLDIVARPGMADVLRLSNPLNELGLIQWQFAADLTIKDASSTFEAGSLILRNVGIYGGGLDITTPATPGVEGFAFGLALRVDIGDVLIRPRGRDDITVADPGTVGEQLRISGVHIGTPDGKPWAIADATTQPGIINAVTDANGQSFLHVGIDWSSAPQGPATGRVVIDNIAFKSDVTGNLDLGSSRINAIQLQYLDIKFR
ncbi:MAG: hypothetical protein IIA02_06030 [Proteobacteria bacterium]|nr:hypothetical protein [Pseudomonadota bacterium]